MFIVRSLGLFLLAGLCEIGGGYLVWMWLREDRSVWYGLIGGIVLVLYGVIPTLQPAAYNFGRVYAAYGGVFVILSLLWGWLIDRKTPDLFDLVPHQKSFVRQHDLSKIWYSSIKSMEG